MEAKRHCRAFAAPVAAAYRWEVPSHLSCTLYILIYILKYILKYIFIVCIWNILEDWYRLRPILYHLQSFGARLVVSFCCFFNRLSLSHFFFQAQLRQQNEEARLKAEARRREAGGVWGRSREDAEGTQ